MIPLLIWGLQPAAVSLTPKVMNHPFERGELNTVTQVHTLHNYTHIQKVQKLTVQYRKVVMKHFICLLFV